MQDGMAQMYFAPDDMKSMFKNVLCAHCSSLRNCWCILCIFLVDRKARNPMSE